MKILIDEKTTIEREFCKKRDDYDDVQLQREEQKKSIELLQRKLNQLLAQRNLASDIYNTDIDDSLSCSMFSTTQHSN